jgi:hypothetical protein
MPEKVFEAFTRLDASDVNTYLVNRPLQNAIINGAFDIWQRGTSFASGGYTADRWLVDYAGGAGTTSRQTFTPGTAPAAGYEGQFFLRKGATTGAQFASLLQRIEDVRTFAGQTITLSFWAKGTNPTGGFAANFIQNFGSGGSGDVAASGQPFSVTDSWQRFFFTFNIPSISGKTVGTNSYLFLSLYQFASNTSASTLDIWGVQVEAGVPTPFRRNANSIQAELAACQRYYVRFGGGSTFQTLNASGHIDTATAVETLHQFPVTMRVFPTSLDVGPNIQIIDANSATFNPTSGNIIGGTQSPNFILLSWAITGGTIGRFAYLRANNDANTFIGFSAEL